MGRTLTSDFTPMSCLEHLREKGLVMTFECLDIHRVMTTFQMAGLYVWRCGQVWYRRRTLIIGDDQPAIVMWGACVQQGADASKGTCTNMYSSHVDLCTELKRYDKSATTDPIPRYRH